MWIGVFYIYSLIYYFLFYYWDIKFLFIVRNYVVLLYMDILRNKKVYVENGWKFGYGLELDFFVIMLSYCYFFYCVGLFCFVLVVILCVFKLCYFCIRQDDNISMG